MEETKIFHESWYRIANQHVSLSAGVKVSRQLFRGARWYVLSDPYSGQFFRMRPPAYDFVARLSAVDSEASFTRLVEAYGIRRTSPGFWKEADWLHGELARTVPIEAGRLDLSRYDDH